MDGKKHGSSQAQAPVGKKDKFALYKQKHESKYRSTFSGSGPGKEVDIDKYRWKDLLQSSGKKVEISKKYGYDQEGEYVVEVKMLIKGIPVNEAEKLSFIEVEKRAVELDNGIIDQMVSAAKSGNWETVFSILDDRPFIVNCIPEHRAWAALHQAVFLRANESVRILLDKYKADIGVMTKTDKAKAAEPATSALELAGRYNPELFQMMSKYYDEIKEAMKAQDIRYFVYHKHGEVDNACKYPLLLLTLASYKETFTENKIKDIDLSQNIAIILSEIMKHSDTTWKTIQQKLHDTIYSVNRENAEELLQCMDKEEFYQHVIKLYTSASGLYHFANAALQRQPKHEGKEYRPIAQDLALGPFILMLDTILLLWDRLIRCAEPTYRGIPENVLSMYKEGETIIFIGFISTSKVKKVAEFFGGDSGTMFVYDNSVSTKWQPRWIGNYSAFFDEQEYLYPLGAEFKITKIQKVSRTIHCKLLDTK